MTPLMTKQRDKKKVRNKMYPDSILDQIHLIRESHWQTLYAHKTPKEIAKVINKRGKK